MKITLNIDNYFIYGFATLAGIGEETKELLKEVDEVTIDNNEIDQALESDAQKFKGAMACIALGVLYKNKED